MGLKLKNIFKDPDDQLDNIEDDFYAGKKESKNIDKSTSNQMILLEPRAFSESQQIADYLKNRNSVVVNLKRVTSDQAKRIIDFLSGVIYAIGGSMQKIGVGIYLCTPKNISVQGKITEDQKNSKEKNIDEDLEW